MSAPVRTRFCPSPTGLVHVGLIRTALFNWAHARHTGGTFVFRIEDTDASRDSEDSYRHLLDSLRWLGLDWDEGPEVGGPHGPYRQSERHEIYADVAAKLLAAGHAYESFSTNEEVDARRRAAGQDTKLGYDNHDRFLTDEQKAAFRAEGRQPVLRLKMPDEDLTWTDLVRGEVRFAAGAVPDFVLVRGNGVPLYPFVNPVDDALMGITDVLRGEDLLPSTPRQLALYAALTDIGVAQGTPRFGHLPLVTGEGTKKLSKRDPTSNLDVYRERGFLPEGLVNYLALLGWSIAEDRDIFSPAEMVEAFDVTRVSANPARFDLKKAEAINATHLRALPVGDFTARVVPYLAAAGLVSDPPTGRAAARPRGDRPARPGADDRAVRRGRPARVPVRRRRRDRGGRGRQAPAAGGRRDPRRGDGGPAGAAGVVDAGDRGGAQGRPRRGAGPQAPAGVRPGAGGRQRPHGLPAALRVDGTAGPRAHARAPGRSPCADRATAGRMTYPGAGFPADEGPYTGPPPMLPPRPAALAATDLAATAWPQQPGPLVPATASRLVPATGVVPAAAPPRRPRRCAGPRRPAPRRTSSRSRTCSAMRSRDWAWWRPLLGLLLVAVVYVVAATVVVVLTLLTGVGTDFAQLDLVDPLTLLVTNLSLIVAIPVVWLAWVTAHGMRPGWSSSVLARLRWRLVLPYSLLALGTLGAGIGLSVLAGVPVRGRAGDRAGRLVRLAAAGRRPDHAAAVGRGGVPLPRVPEPGHRRRGCATRRPAR